MKNSRLWASIIGFTTLAAGLLVFNLATDRTPVLGLDLKGGLSVIYATAEPATGDDLIVVRDLMRDQLESFGIAEPDVRVEGDNVIVDLPGVSDQSEAFEALKVSGIVELRPVIQCQAIDPSTLDTSSTVPGETIPGTTVPGATVDTTTPSSSIDSSVSSIDSSALGVSGPRAARSRAGFPRTAPDTSTTAPTQTTTPADSTTDTTPTSIPADDSTVEINPSTVPPIAGPPAPTTTLSPEDSGQDFLLSEDGLQACLVGPAGGTGEVFERGSAKAGLDQNGAWAVDVTLRADGKDQWNALAAECNAGGATCPSRQLAIVLDDRIQSAPTVNEPNFPDNVQISGSFTESEVRDLARVLNRGAFPVEIVQQRVETVSPTAGKNSLQSAVIAGLIGVGLMLAFMIFYYRKLAVVIISGLVVWSMAVFSLASWVSNTWNYAFTIAGATGLIVSVGVTVDTYVVFFERIRDETRHGRSLINAAPRSFAATWKTIAAANFVSLLAAFILFWLSVGSVKGFALYLGLTTVCDLLVCYFFTRPAIYLLAQTKWFASTSKASSTSIGAAS